MARPPTRTPEPLSPRKRWLIAELLASVLAPVMVLFLGFLLMGLAHSAGRWAGMLTLLMPGLFLMDWVPRHWTLPMLIAVQWLVCLPLCWLMVGWWDRRRLPPWARDWAKS